MGRKLGNMDNWIGGVLVVGNELSKVDTLKSLAKTALNSGEMVGEIIGGSVLVNAEEFADKVYVETVEMLSLYLANLVDDENDDEDDSPTCVRCGEVGCDGDWLDGIYVCYECMTTKEYRSLENNEDEDENDDAVCGRCGVVIPEDEDGGDYIIASDEYVCYKCMSAEEYRNQ